MSAGVQESTNQRSGSVQARREKRENEGPGSSKNKRTSPVSKFSTRAHSSATRACPRETALLPLQSPALTRTCARVVALLLPFSLAAAQQKLIPARAPSGNRLRVNFPPSQRSCPSFRERGEEASPAEFGPACPSFVLRLPRSQATESEGAKSSSPSKQHPGKQPQKVPRPGGLRKKAEAGSRSVRRATESAPSERTDAYGVHGCVRRRTRSSEAGRSERRRLRRGVRVGERGERKSGRGREVSALDA